jgi:dipeptidyl aminopeptidase/acylaminoacyl peptidase
MITPLPRYFRNRSHRIILNIFLISTLAGLASAQHDTSTASIYRMPPAEIAEIIDAPPVPHISVSPDNEWILLLKRPNLPSIEEIAQPELRLAGRRINPRTNGPSRSFPYTGLVLKRISDLEEREITNLPDNAQIRNVVWSPDGKKVAFTNTIAEGIELWVVDVKQGEAEKIPGIMLNDASGEPFHWLSDSRTIICKTIPAARGPAPEKPAIPQGPIIQENLGQKAPAVTYADLLKNPHDEELLEYYMNTRLVQANINGETISFGLPGMIARAEPSPDGQYILVEKKHRPFSYLVNVRHFPTSVEIWDLKGNIVRLVADQPLAEDVPTVTAAVRSGPRDFDWRDDAGAILYWAEALDGGDPRNEVDVREQIYNLEAPFKGNPIPLITLNLRYRNIKWKDENLALISEWWWTTRRFRTWIFAPRSPRIKPEVLLDYIWEDRYNHPGTPLIQPSAAGRRVLLTGDDGRSIFLCGDGASPEGNRPFLDRFDLKTMIKERMWRSEAPYYEKPVRLLDAKKQHLLTSRESTVKPPNYFVRDLRKGKIRQLTSFPHPTPQLADVYKELIRYKRGDGIEMTAILYLPAGYKPEDGPLPTLIWAYPHEFKSADAAGQVTDSPYRFIKVGWWSPMLWLTQGYAVVDNPSMPIIGEGDREPNDTFVEQLVEDARAVIEEAVRRGVADPDRIAVGGHSYGAFMAANLLAHSDLFCAGIARTGAYNRTLTPFGFQNEDRTLWEAPEVYFEMSPFMHIDKIDEPILLIHGEADNNPGTFPMQSQRFFNALKGHGATCRLIMLPHECHGYRARESIMHMAWEMDRWLDKYVKNAPPRKTAKAGEEKKDTAKDD